MPTTGPFLSSAGGPSAVTEIYSYAVSTGGWTQWVSQAKETQALRTAQQAAHELHEAGTSEEAIAAMMADHECGSIPGASTGIHEPDEASGGMKPGQLWVIAGHTSRGKSVLMLQIAAGILTMREFLARMVRTPIAACRFDNPATDENTDLNQSIEQDGTLEKLDSLRAIEIDNVLIEEPARGARLFSQFVASRANLCP